MRGLQNGIFCESDATECGAFGSARVLLFGRVNPRPRFKNRTWGTLRVVASCEWVTFSGSIDGLAHKQKRRLMAAVLTHYYPKDVLAESIGMSRESWGKFACLRGQHRRLGIRLYFSPLNDMVWNRTMNRGREKRRSNNGEQQSVSDSGKAPASESGRYKGISNCRRWRRLGCRGRSSRCGCGRSACRGRAVG